MLVPFFFISHMYKNIYVVRNKYISIYIYTHDTGVCSRQKKLIFLCQKHACQEGAQNTKKKNIQTYKKEKQKKLYMKPGG